MEQEKKDISEYKQSLRERIVEVAMQAFAKQGIKAVRMNDIAHLLGISKRTLYEVFDTKEAVLLAGVLVYSQRQQQAMQQKYRDCHNVMDYILTQYRTRVEEWRTTNPQFYTDIDLYPSVKRLLASEQARRQAHLLEFLQRGVNEGYFKDGFDLNLVVQLFNVIGEHIMNKQMYHQYSVEHIFLTMLLIPLRGLCTEKGVKVLDNFFN